MKKVTQTTRNIIILIVLITATVSCGGNKPILRADLDLALRLSEANRPELEKVLKYYSKDKKDSLKLKAAKFLISNMIFHYSISGEYMDEYIAKVDSVYSELPGAMKTIHYRVPERVNAIQYLLDIKLDLQTIIGDFLIENIENSFKLWEKNRSIYNITFDDFCEYILPYRVDKEPLIQCKDTLIRNYYHLGNLQNDELDLNTYSDYINNMEQNSYSVTNRVLVDTLLMEYTPDCIDYAYNEIIVKRSVGIPCAIDFVPHHPNKDGRHFWTTIINSKYNNSNYTTVRNSGAAKVFRKTYSINQIPEDSKNFIPKIFTDPYVKDVTEIYDNVVTIEYDFKNVSSKIENGYLAVFNSLSWHEVAWAKLKNGKAVFEKMGCDVVYMPTYYIKNKQSYGDYPIILRADGTIERLVANKIKKQNLTLKRKYTYNRIGEFYGQFFVGCDVVASNDLKILKFDSISTISHYRSMEYDTIHLQTTKKYKNWLLRNNIHRGIYLSELEFYDENGKRLVGESFVIKKDQSIAIGSMESQAIFDNDLLTAETIEYCVGLSFAKPESVSYIKYISDNDENGVYPGEEYELLYFENGEWVSMGRKIATDYSIYYEDAPTNALFWLRNHTKGVQERPFTIDNGKIKFW